MIETLEWRQKIDTNTEALAAEMTAAAAMIREHEGKAIDFCRRLLAITRAVLEEKRSDIPDTGWPVIVVALFVQMVSVLRAALTVGTAGHGRELPILVRPALEALITLSFIADADSALRARRWVQFTFVAKKALMEKHPHLFRGTKNRNVRRRVRDRARRVRRHFPSNRFWAIGLGCNNLREMARQVDLLWHYDAVYWAGSQPTHASAIAVDELIDVVAKGAPIYKVGLSGKGVRREMAATCDLLIRGLERLNTAFALGIAPILEDLKSEYSATMRKILE